MSSLFRGEQLEISQSRLKRLRMSQNSLPVWLYTHFCMKIKTVKEFGLIQLNPFSMYSDITLGVMPYKVASFVTLAPFQFTNFSIVIIIIIHWSLLKVSLCRVRSSPLAHHLKQHSRNRNHNSPLNLRATIRFNVISKPLVNIRSTSCWMSLKWHPANGTTRGFRSASSTFRLTLDYLSSWSGCWWEKGWVETRRRPELVWPFSGSS